MVLVWFDVSSDETKIECCGSSDDLQDWRHCGSWSSICSRWDQETFFRITHRTGFFEPTDQRTGTTCFDSLVPGGRLARKQDQSWSRHLEFTRRQCRSNFWKRLNRTWIWLLILWSWNGIIRWGLHQKLSYKTFSMHRKFNFNTFNVHLKKPFSRYSNLWWLSYHGRW